MVWKCPNTANESSPEPLESGKDKQVKITIESDSEQDGVRYQQRKNRPHGLVSLSEHFGFEFIAFVDISYLNRGSQWGSGFYG